MIAIVTGAPGWLGTRLVEVLVNGLPDRGSLGPIHEEIRCLVAPGADGRALAGSGPQVRLFPGDLRRPDSLASLCAGAGGATVFHSAGVIHPRLRTTDFYASNVEGTQNLIAQARAAGIRRFVHVSSNSPLGCNATPTEVFDESAPYNPYLGYGRSKKLAEDAVNAAGVRGDFETVIVRPPWFYGPHQPSRQSLFYTMIRTGRVPIMGAGENRRSMAYIDNICQGLLLAERMANAAGQTYWIADRQPYSMNQILSTIEDVMERDFGIVPARRRVRLPPLAGKAAWLVDRTLQGAGLYQQKIHVLGELGRTIACSIKKAQAEIGYDPLIDLAEGTRRSILWMNEAGIAW